MQRIGAGHGVAEDEQDDFVQDTWCAVLVALRDGRFDRRRGRFRDWLRAVVRYRAITWYRKARVRKAMTCEYPVDELVDPLADQPEVIVEARQTLQVARKILTRLRRSTSTTCFSVFYLRRVRGLSVADTAAHLKLSSGQVRVYDHRVRRKAAVIARRHEVERAD